MNRSGKCEGPGEGDRRGALCTGFTLVTIKSHHLHACNIRGAMGEIASYHKRD